jgi:hypothetical protein
MKTRLAAWFALVLPVLRLAADELVVQASRDFYTRDIAISDDGKLVATSTPYGRLCVWDSATGQLLESLKGGTTDLTFSPDGRYLISDCDLWDWLEKRLVWSNGGSGYLYSIAVDSTRKLFYLARASVLEIRSLESGAIIKKLSIEGTNLTGAELSDTGDLMLLCEKTGILFYNYEEHRIKRRLGLDYPIVPVFPGHKDPKMAAHTQIGGRPYWLVNRAGSRVMVNFHKLVSNGDREWSKYLTTDPDGPVTEVPLQALASSSTWCGTTDQRFVLESGAIYRVGPEGKDRQRLGIDLPPKTDVIWFDTDLSGKMLVVGTEAGWSCYEGDPEDPASWKKRTWQPVPKTAKLGTIRPASGDLLHGTSSGTIRETRLTEGLPGDVLGTLGDEVKSLQCFADGTLAAYTKRESYLLKDGAPVRTQADTEPFFSIRCGPYLLEDAHTGYRCLGPDGKASEPFSLESGPCPHPTLPLFMDVKLDYARATFRLHAIGSDGIPKIRHELELPSERGYPPMPENDATFLTVDHMGGLQRTQFKSGKATRIRDTVPHPEIKDGYLSPKGDFVVMLGEDAPYVTVVPLDPKKPCREVTCWSAEIEIRLMEWIGFTPDGTGFWLREYSQDDVVENHFANSAILVDGGSGKAIARAWVFEEGGAVIALPDGRATFSPHLGHLVLRRAKGSRTLSPVASSPEVLSLLKPYLKPR